MGYKHIKKQILFNGSIRNLGDNSFVCEPTMGNKRKSLSSPAWHSRMKRIVMLARIVKRRKRQKRFLLYAPHFDCNQNKIRNIGMVVWRWTYENMKRAGNLFFSESNFYDWRLLWSNSLSLLSLDFLQMCVRIDMNFSNVATAKGALPVAASMLASRSRQTIGYKYS